MKETNKIIQQQDLKIVIDKYKVNQVMLSEKIGMNVNVFRSKYTRLRDQYRFSDAENQQILTALLEMAAEITALE